MWNDLTMKERADLIKQGVALGYKDIDAIRNNYHTFSKGDTVYTDSNPYYNRLPDSKKKEWRSLSARRQQFLKLMQQYAPQLYNDSQLRNVMEYIAFNEGRWGNTGVSKQGARGYFQLMPDTIATASRNAGRNYNINNPADDFAMTQITAQNSMKYIQKLWQNPEFRRKAEEKGYTPYDLLMSSWLAGPTGMKNNILKGTNPKDAYGTSISNYVGNTYSQPGTNTMVINTGIEGKPVIITSTPEVEEAVRQNNMPNDVTVSDVPIQQDQDVSNTYLLDQYNRILGDNEALRGQYEELSEQERQLKERYEEVLQEQEQENQAKYLRSLLNIGRTTPVMQVPALGTISTQSAGSINDPYSNNNILAQQMYGTKMGNMRNGSFGKYFFNNPEERTPVVVNYNPYSPIQGGFAYGGNIHRFGEGDTIVTRPPLQAAQNQFAVPEYHYYDDWDPEQFYPTTKIGDAIYDNFDANAPAEPIQSYPNVGEVNPKYYNPTVKGEPVKILHRVQDNDQQAVAQYQDGELGIVNLPDNYWQRYLPEVVVPGRMQQLQGVIDQANEGKTIFEQQQDMEDAFRYQDEVKRAQQDSFYNPRAILDNTSRIPIIGALPAISEYAYGTLKGGPEGQYWKDRASGAAEEQLLPIGLVAANSNPITAAMVDSSLLGTSLYDINRNGLNKENAVGLAMGLMGPVGRGTSILKDNPAVSQAVTNIKDNTVKAAQTVERQTKRLNNKIVKQLTARQRLNRIQDIIDARQKRSEAISHRIWDLRDEQEAWEQGLYKDAVENMHKQGTLKIGRSVDEVDPNLANSNLADLKFHREAYPEEMQPLDENLVGTIEVENPIGTAVKAGEYEWPEYSTGNMIKGDIGDAGMSGVIGIDVELLNKNPGAVVSKLSRMEEEAAKGGVPTSEVSLRYLNHELKDVKGGAEERVTNTPEEISHLQQLQNVLDNNTRYLQEYVPGFKPVGSSVGARAGAIKNIPHDIDGYITRADFENFQRTHPEAKLRAKNTEGTTYELTLNDDWGDAGVVDLNIVDVGKDGIGNARAVQLYQQYFPDEYANTVRRLSTEGKLTKGQEFEEYFPLWDMEGKPMTAEQLLERYNPEVGTILDSFTADFGKPSKTKHGGRSIHYMTGDRPDLVHQALQQYADMLVGGQGKGRLLPRLTFGTAEENAALLRELNFVGDIQAAAKDPAKMQNILDAWYLTEGGVFGRAAGAGDRGEGHIGTLQKIARNFSKWLFTGEGGTASGYGQNWVAGSTSGAGRDLVGMLQPEIQGLQEGMSARNAVNTVKRAMLHPDYKLTAREAKMINEVYAKHNIPIAGQIKEGMSGPDLIKMAPSAGQDIYNANKEIAQRLGVNFTTGEPYGYHEGAPYYTGSMRDFEFKGQNLNEGKDLLGIKRFDGPGRGEVARSWRDRMNIGIQNIGNNLVTIGIEHPEALKGFRSNINDRVKGIRDQIKQEQKWLEGQRLHYNHFSLLRNPSRNINRNEYNLSVAKRLAIAGTAIGVPLAALYAKAQKDNKEFEKAYSWIDDNRNDLFKGLSQADQFAMESFLLENERAFLRTQQRGTKQIQVLLRSKVYNDYKQKLRRGGWLEGMEEESTLPEVQVVGKKQKTGRKVNIGRPSK